MRELGDNGIKLSGKGLKLSDNWHYPWENVNRHDNPRKASNTDLGVWYPVGSPQARFVEL